MRKRVGGVSMIEILVVVALLSILGILSYTGWQLQLMKSRDARRKADLNGWRNALINYRDDAGCFPEMEIMECDSTALEPYLERVPCDPTSNETHRYRYWREDCNTFYIFTILEYGGDSIIARLGCLSGCGPGENRDYNYFVASDDVSMGGGRATDVLPTCGSATKYCFSNQCGSCCPGTNYRCNSEGTACMVDETCGLGI